jgi:hypothetical protein
MDISKECSKKVITGANFDPHTDLCLLLIQTARGGMERLHENGKKVSESLRTEWAFARSRLLDRAPPPV